MVITRFSPGNYMYLSVPGELECWRCYLSSASNGRFFVPLQGAQFRPELPSQWWVSQIYALAVIRGRFTNKSNINILWPWIPLHGGIKLCFKAAQIRTLLRVRLLGLSWAPLSFCRPSSPLPEGPIPVSVGLWTTVSDRHGERERGRLRYGFVGN